MQTNTTTQTQVTTNSNPLKTLVITKPNFTGIWGAYLFSQNFWGGEYTILFTDEFDLFSNPHYLDQYERVILLDIPLKNNQMNKLMQVYEKFVQTNTLIHVAIYGDEIPLYIHSLVRDPEDTTTTVLDMISDKLAQLRNPDKEEELNKVLDGVRDYQTYTLEQDGHGKTMYNLFMHFGKVLPSPSYTAPFEEMVDRTFNTEFGRLNKLLSYREAEYVISRVTQAQYREIGENSLVVYVEAEKYVNEIAHKIMEQRRGYDNVIVFVKIPTKGDDLIHVRTSTEKADIITQAIIGERRGNKHASSFFSPAMRGSVANALKSSLDENMDLWYNNDRAN